MRVAWLTTAWIALAISACLAGCEAFPEAGDEPSATVVQADAAEAAQEQKIETARAAQSRGDYDEAIALFQDVLAENPTITTAYLGIGEIYMIKKDFRKAEPAYGRAARLEPRNFDAQYGHGLSLQMLERFTEAIRAYHRALTIRPDSAEANLNIATTYLRMEEPGRAITFAERAVEAQPDNGPARANLGAIYEQLGRYTDAIDTYLAAIELMGNRPQLMANLINVLIKENRYREAANTAQILIRLDPTAEAYERLGWCSFKLREYEESIDAYRNAIEIDPDYWPALNGIGVNALNTWLLSKKRNTRAKTEARDAFRRSLRVNSDQPKVVRLLLNYQL